jgi:hypothetical protein
MATQTTETVYVTVNSTEQEIMEGVLGNSIVAMAKLIERYQKQIEFYENMEFIIVSKTPEKFSFIAEKKYMND